MKSYIKIISYEMGQKCLDKNGSFYGRKIIDWRVKASTRMTFFRVRHFSSWQSATIVRASAYQQPFWKFLCPTCDSSVFKLAVAVNGTATCRHCDPEIALMRKINEHRVVQSAKKAIRTADWAYVKHMIAKMGTYALRARQALELTGHREPLFTPDMSWKYEELLSSQSDQREYDGPKGIIYTEGTIKCIGNYPKGIKLGSCRAGRVEEVVWATSEDLYGQETDDWPVGFGYEEL